tara:strand:+ start:6876 stop:8123 length:1248 start_codon:yes stop_codon:yes gene_type:complete
MDTIKKIFRFNNLIKINLRIVAPILFLCVIGLVALKSTSIDTLGEHSVFNKQCVWLLFGVLIFIFFQFIRNQVLYEYSYILYLFLLFLIAITLFMPEINNSSRWIFIGPYQFQPSEFGKIIIILALSRFIADYKDTFSDHQIICLSSVISIFPLLLIFEQPDYGTGLMYLLPVLPMLYWSGVKFKILLLYLFPVISMLAAYNLTAYYIWMVLLVAILFYFQFRMISIVSNFIINITFGILNAYAWDHLLKEYHQKRIFDFFESIFNPENSDHMGVGYQAFQSKVAIGSGGFFGKGIGEGTQSYLRFLPIKDSDFILSVISEEMGLFLIIIIMLSFLVFLYFSVDYAQRLFNKFYSLCLVGFSSILFFHIIVNMSMVSGLFPVIGLPFPFVSYGGSFMLSCFIMIAIMNNIINNDL